MRQQSTEARRIARIRAQMAREKRESGHVMCQWPAGCNQRWTDQNEILSRARGGSPIDPGNIIDLCREHHSWLTTHPREAHEMGLQPHGWER